MTQQWLCNEYFWNGGPFFVTTHPHNQPPPPHATNLSFPQTKLAMVTTLTHPALRSQCNWTRMARRLSTRSSRSMISSGAGRSSGPSSASWTKRTQISTSQKQRRMIEPALLNTWYCIGFICRAYPFVPINNYYSHRLTKNLQDSFSQLALPCCFCDCILK